MSEELDHRLDERLRSALHDLDQRVALRVRERAGQRTGTNELSLYEIDAPSATGSRPAPSARPRRRLGPILAGATVIAMLITVGWLARPTGSAPPTIGPPATSPSATSAPTPTPTVLFDGPDSEGSQSQTDAIRDGVPGLLAWINVSERVLPLTPDYEGIATRITAPEGTWLISRPDTYKINPKTGCVATKGKPRNSARIAKYDACSEYSEILLMSPDLKRILRAYPVPNLPVQWLVLTKDAIYCGRQGDGAIPDSMICRIDRTTHTFTGRVFPFSGAEGGSSPHSFTGWPGTWKNNTPSDVTGFDQAQLGGGVLRISDPQGKLTIRLDPVTLKPVS